MYEKIISVICAEDDFYRVAITYLRKVRSQGVLYVEIFFDPQMHTTRGITFDDVMAGLKRAKGKLKIGVGSPLPLPPIPSFLSLPPRIFRNKLFEMIFPLNRRLITPSLFFSPNVIIEI